MYDLDRIKNEIVSRVNIVDVVMEHVALKRRGSRWVGLCPFHSEKTPSFTVTPDKGFFKCFGCGRGGDIFTFVQLRENVDFGEALRFLADRAGVELRHGPHTDSKGTGRADLAKVNEWAAKFFRRLLTAPASGSPVADYLRSRGVSPEIEDQFRLGYAADDLDGLVNTARAAGFSPEVLLAADLVRSSEHGRLYCTFRNRLMFPIRDAMNRVVGFGGRTLGDDPAKYLNTRQNALFDKGRGLYGIDLARRRISEVDRSIVVEGYTDCLAAHQAGFIETVATLGTALTESQVDLLRRYGGTAILLFDADKAGEAAAERAIRVALPRHLVVRLARIPDGKDPADFLQRHDSDTFAQLLNSAVDALEFKWQQTVRRFGEDLDGRHRREAVTEFMAVVAEAFQSGVVDAIDRGLVVNQIAKLVSIDTAGVHALLQQATRRGVSGSVPHTPVEAGDAANTGRTVDAEQAGLTRMLEVLLNEPGLFESCQGLFEPDRFDDVRDRRIAELVKRLAESCGEFALSEVMAGCEDPATGARAAELAHRGERRGNYERTLLVARSMLEHVKALRQGEALKDVRLTHDGSDDASAASKQVEALLEGLRRPHYVPRRMRRTNPRVIDG